MEQTNRSSVVSLASIHTVNARESLHQIRRFSEDSYYDLEVDAERYWRLSYLKGQFRNLDLTHLFHRYTQRINHGYFSLFLILQVVLSITHFCIVLWANMEASSLRTVLTDLTIYAITFILSLVGLLFTDSFVKKHPKLLTVASVLVFVILFINNFFIPFYHGFIAEPEEHLRPAYTTHIIITCYIFLNVKHTIVALLLGFTATIAHVVVEIFITYKDRNMLYERVGSDLLYLVCINGLGVYFRFLNEIVKRRGFLDRRACVESTLKLKFEKEQEEQLMLSIIPKHIIEEVREDLLSTIQHIEKTDRLPSQKPFENPYINEHNNVTILYADIVNYTEMTTKLKPATKLVETLNELFGRFDDASEEFNVLRIKFLGDCYYCVAGLPPNPVPNHAEACVELGLQMIKIIREVREHRNLLIDMRIGVHSGSVLSGLIGLMKWQFDVWSKDVDIANRMETRGQPGKVHITKQTRDLLQKTYNITPCAEGETDSMLKQHNIKTFLVSPPVDVTESSPPQTIKRNGSVVRLADIEEAEKTDTSSMGTSNGDAASERPSIAYDYHNQRKSIVLPNGNADAIYDFPSQRRDSRFLRRPSGNPNLANIEKRVSGSVSSPFRPTNGRRSGTINVRERRNTPSDVKRRTAFMDNNINRYQERLKNTDVSMKNAIETMPLSKYEQWFKAKDINPFFLIFKNLNTEFKFVQLPDPLFKYYLLAAVLAVVFIFVIQNLTLAEWRWSAWLSYATIGVIVLCLLPLVWLLTLWNRYKNRGYAIDEMGPKGGCLKFLYKFSEVIPRYVIIRTVIYLVISFLVVWCVFLGMVDCKERFSDSYTVVRMSFFDALGYRNEYHCIVPWHMTETCALTILVSFSFLRIHMWIKFIIASGITAFYCMVVWNFTEGFYEDSETINHMVKPRVAHILTIIFLTITLHLIDRQTDYMNRLDFQWNEQLVEERKEANSMHKINNILLKNILPVHVADLYLNVNRQSGELYHESYDCVAVMFASIVDYSVEALDEKKLLLVMNQIIGDFDKLLNRTEGKKIEKIKVAKWTYMAACGLDPGRRDSFPGAVASSHEHAVVSLVKFAADMMDALHQINEENFQQIKLRIGIAHGELTAGVIGSKKPLYDVWGDPVNMASRMDSTGVPGKIQVPKATADVLMQYSIMCQYRDDMHVKGIQHPVPTYFVSLDKDNRLIVV